MNRADLKSDPHPSAPPGAPNVLIVLLDDMGFGASSAFGGPCRMPTAERLAEEGLRYSRFHTTAICSPTRQALLTGRNHHSVGMGGLTNMADERPGYDAVRSASAGTLAQTLMLNGYATAAFGKMHQTPHSEFAADAPKTHWPTNEGFEKFYGFLGGETNQFSPPLVDGLTFIDPPAAEAYHVSEDLVEQVAAWIRHVRADDPEQPWFAYLAFGATHAPFHVPEDWRDRYRGEFADGWDAQRERTLARQRELGVVPEDAELAPWAEGVPHWDEISDDARIVAARLMEVYAAFAEHTDAQVGRLVDELTRLGELDNTVVFYILGDNGASAEGGIAGSLNEGLMMNGLNDDTDRILAQLDDIGSPSTYPHYNVGWALAMDTPYQWAKQVASHYGGTRNGLVVHWPAGLRETGGVRHHWHHVIDVVPTVLDVAGLPQPTTIEGVRQDPIHGTSMLGSFRAAASAETHTTQYFEIHGSRGIYHEGWVAAAKHRSPWLRHPLHAIAEDRWELYDTTSDWTQARDLAAEQPEKLAELQALFDAEAEKYRVFPLRDPIERRSLPEFVTAPGSRTVTLTPADGRIPPEAAPGLKGVSWRATADLEVDGSADGVVIAQGGRFGGWAIFLIEGRPAYAHNYLGIDTVHVLAEEAIPAGRHQLDVTFDYDGGGLGRGGDIEIAVDGIRVATGRLARTVPLTYSIVEGLYVGIDKGTPVSDRYSRADGNPFTGTVHSVTLTEGNDLVRPSQDEALNSVLAGH